MYGTMLVMTGDWENTFSEWTGPASDAEQDRYEWTRNAINDALRVDCALKGHSFDVYAKGSYPNVTNVIRDSDVDIAVELTEMYESGFHGDAKGLNLADVRAIPYQGTYGLPQFKDEVERALRNRFGDERVDRGRTAIHIRESHQGLAAEVVPCVTHRSFYSRSGFHRGIKMLDDARPYEDVLNYPKQHLKRGTSKDDCTQRCYRRVVRILKRLENEMVDRGVIDPVPSFLIESGVYNVPDTHFNHADTWRERIQKAVHDIYQGTLTEECVGSDAWMEANGIKYLFHPSQNWTYQQANEFTLKAWEYASLGD